jgi:hypothetical protein
MRLQEVGGQECLVCGSYFKLQTTRDNLNVIIIIVANGTAYAWSTIDQ